MKSTQLYILASCLCLCLYSWSALAINRCTDANGKVAFQDKPCPVSSTTEKIKQNFSNTTTTIKHGVQLKDVTIGSNKTFTVGLPDSWQVTVQHAGAEATRTLRAVPEKGDALVLLMSFLPKRQSVGVDAMVLDRIMQDIHERHSVNPDERRLASTPIKPVFAKGVGHVLSYVNEALLADVKRPSTEFTHLTTGALVIEGMTVSVSVLNNDLSGENYMKAMLALATIVYRDGLSAE
jgi:Domain of unknown function (DUF4124)